MVRHVSFSEIYEISQCPGPGKPFNAEHPYYTKRENTPATLPRFMTLSVSKYPKLNAFICREKPRHHRYSEIFDPTSASATTPESQAPSEQATPSSEHGPTAPLSQHLPTSVISVVLPRHESSGPTASHVMGPSPPSSSSAVSSQHCSSANAVTYGEVVAVARTLAKGLIASGLKHGDTVGCIGPNSIDWVSAELAVICAGAVFVPFEECTSAEALSHYAKECRCSLFFVGSEAQEAKIMEAWHGLPDLRMVIKCHAGPSAKTSSPSYEDLSEFEEPHERASFTVGRGSSVTNASCETVFSTDSLLTEPQDAGSPEDDFLINAGDNMKEVVSMAALLRVGATEPDDKLDEEMSSQSSGDVCLILFTAGTSGLRKGAMLSHDNLIFSGMKIAECLNSSFQLFGETGCVATFASFASSLGQTLGLFVPLLLSLPVVIAPPEATNMADEGAIRNILRTHKPMVLVATPQHLAALRRIAWKDELEHGRLLRVVQKWSKFWTLAYHLDRMKGRSWLPQTLSYHMFRLITLWKTKHQMGMEKCRVIICSGAYIPLDTLESLLSLDFPIVQGYLVTEAAGLCHLEDPRFTILGSVGPAIPGFRCRIEDPDENGNGEVMIKGRHVFVGYINDPVKTMSALTDDGWLRTGDLGKIDRFGRLYIIARKNEMVTLSNGKTVIASHVEKHILNDLPCLSHALVVGEARPYLSVLLSMKTEIDRRTGLPLDDLTAEAAEWCKMRTNRVQAEQFTVSGILAATDQAVMKAIGRAIHECNEKWATCDEEKVVRWRILPTSFSPAGEECGPAMTIRRRVALSKYHGLVDSMYEEQNS